MKIISAACLLLFLRNSAGSNIRRSLVLEQEQKHEESASILDVSLNKID
jgi:hypothetical protein